MKQRKTWTNEEDKVLRYLIEQRGMTKWSRISDVMEKEFQLLGRNGKQCRERYHNHLDKNISNEEWTLQEEDKLFQMQDELGNKWALISNKLPGRTDNCVKNHFYSKLRKSLRLLNKKIHKHLKREYKDIRTATLYRIIEIIQNHHKLASNILPQTYELCRKIKNQLRRYDDSSDSFQNQQEELTFIRGLLEDIALFDKEVKKVAKKPTLKGSTKLDEEDYSTKSKSNRLSTNSVCDDDQSDYSNSDLFSSSSIDHKSFYSSRGNRLLKPQTMICKSQSIESESQEESDPQNEKILCMSAQLKKKEQKPPKPLALTSSLTLPPLLGQHLRMKEKKKSTSSKSNSHNSIDENEGEQDSQNNVMYTYMMGEEPLSMRLLSPQKLTIQDKMEINYQDDLFYGQSMQIQDHNLVKTFEGMSLGAMPKLGHSVEL